MKKIVAVILLTVMILWGPFDIKGPANAAQKTASASKTNKEDEKMEMDFKDETYKKEDGIGVIYLAGGCFWGLEKLMQNRPGGIRGTRGYANGDPSLRPTYKEG